MAKFVFKFDGVLRQREHVEQQCQRELAVVQQEMTRLQTELRQLNESVEGSTSDLRDNHLTGRLDMNFLAAHRRFMLGIQRKAMGLVQRMADVQTQAAEAQAALAEAAKQRKIMEKLREKSLERWKAECSRRETAENDEIAMQIGYRNSLADAARAGSAGSADSAEAPA